MNPTLRADPRREHATASSDRAFGLVFAAVFASIGAQPLVHGGEARVWALAAAAAFLVAALARPGMLAPLNRAWSGFGMLLSRVTNPVVLGILFFGAMVPTGLLMRLFRRRPLALEIDREARSYWIVRDPPGPAPETMTRQF